MTPYTKRVTLEQNFKPTQLPGLQAWYDLSVPTSYITATGVKLLGDLSGNSNTNVLALNGVTANYASSPDSVPTSITGTIDLRARVACDNWTLGTYQPILSKNVDTGSQVSYALGVTATTGTLSFRRSPDGTTASRIVSVSTVAPTVSNFSDIWVRATLNTATGDVTFYTGTDGVSWTQLGAVVSTAATGIFDGTAGIEVGSINASATVLTGKIYRAQIYNGIAGTLVFDADFGGVAKLATSFTERSSNAATVTINTSGDLGARICGARDYVNLTGANQLTLSGGNALGDGVSQYWATAGFALGTVHTRFLVINQKTWTSGDYLCDGRTANTSAIIQTTGTPQLNISAGSSVAANTGLAVNTLAVVTMIINGASSSLQINKGTPTTGNAGSGVPNGLTLAATATPGNYGNVLYAAELVYSGALDAGTVARVQSYLGRRFNVPAAM